MSSGFWMDIVLDSGASVGYTGGDYWSHYFGIELVRYALILFVFWAGVLLLAWFVAVQIRKNLLMVIAAWRDRNRAE